MLLNFETLKPFIEKYDVNAFIKVSSLLNDNQRFAIINNFKTFKVLYFIKKWWSSIQI